MNPERQQPILIKRELASELKRVCVDKLPRQAYGLIGGADVWGPSSIYPCSSHLRDSPEWSYLFESFGEFYRDSGRGFAITPEELGEKRRQMKSRNESFVGVFHSHRRHGPESTKADLKVHVYPRVLRYIVSVLEPEYPELKVYRLFESHFELAHYEIVD